MEQPRRSRTTQAPTPLHPHSQNDAQIPVIDSLPSMRRPSPVPIPAVSTAKLAAPPMPPSPFPVSTSPSPSPPPPHLPWSAGNRRSTADGADADADRAAQKKKLPMPIVLLVLVTSSTAPSIQKALGLHGGDGAGVEIGPGKLETTSKTTCVQKNSDLPGLEKFGAVSQDHLHLRRPVQRQSHRRAHPEAKGLK
ncbi:uncharacterized protein [Lolium perenne]|uniref:uncharacterized protein isoform X2 n=1 Tax=Lolium perenne TaxID=4522 RepID=UPI0021F61651|nr:uncharacterized protein LOC127316415 isoform X2 [Lolium perenne]